MVSVLPVHGGLPMAAYAAALAGLPGVGPAWLVSVLPSGPPGTPGPPSWPGK